MVAIAACGNKHVKLESPGPGLSASQRVRLFERLRTSGQGVEVELNCHQNGCGRTVDEVLVIGDGTLVRRAEDLIPVLPANSVAGRAAKDVAVARARAARWNRVAGITFVAGLVAGTAAGLTEHFMLCGASFIVGGFGAVGIRAAGWLDTRAEIENGTAIAFEHYDAGLAQRLDVCVDGLVVVPCVE